MTESEMGVINAAVAYRRGQLAFENHNKRMFDTLGVPMPGGGKQVANADALAEDQRLLNEWDEARVRLNAAVDRLLEK